ncbi:MAG: hypothetical protein IJX39_01720 [Clostridia bacterium]|nr:hypothetical protein [Clostridia bacterium]
MESNIAVRVPAYVTAVMDTLERAGHRGYLVGGSLRDLLLDKTPHDFDLTTDATPEEMLVIFSDFRVIPTGLRHGTLTVLSQGQPIEVTTHRVDGDYLDARRPESVFFTRRLADDLSRRDFTVNAMAWHPAVGLVDLFGGREDLQSGILRAVGDPVARFTEDALRILRAFRFSAQLGFSIEKNTLTAARETRAGLERISAERIFSEISRLLICPAAPRGLDALFAADCQEQVFFDAAPKTDLFSSLTSLPIEAELRLALLLSDRTAKDALKLCRRWRASNAFAERVCGLLKAAGEPLPDSLYTARRFVCGYWKEWDGALILRQTLGQNTEEARKLCKTVAKNGTAIELRRLAVNGKELQERLSVRPAKTGELLKRLQDLCWQEPQQNKKGILLALADEICRKEKGFV